MSSLYEIYLTYTEFVSNVIEKNIPYRSLIKTVDTDNYYTIIGIDEPIIYKCEINDIDDSTSTLDYITNYQENERTIINNRESGTGHLIVKPRPVEARFFQDFVYFKTGDNSSLDAGGNSYWSIDTTNSGITKVSFQPNYGYYIDGGSLHADPNTYTNDIKVKVVLAPDIPVEYGGSHCFISNKTLKNSPLTHWHSIDIETTPAYVKYDSSVPYASKAQIIIEHDPNDQAELEITLRLYK